LVLLADESHHINAWTRRDKRTLTTQERAERTWENTVSRLLAMNPLNRLLEFTATIDLTNEELFKKYKGKVVYQYDLRRFMEDGFSKNVMLLRTDEADSSKMLHGMLLSQYRKYLARDFQIELKPVILFKSNTIAISLDAQEAFLNMVEELTVEGLRKTIERGVTLYKDRFSIWSRMFTYYCSQDLTQVIHDLQWDFAQATILNANARDFLSEENSLLLNSLEDLNNPIRTIFAVARLNEGWDVLNLFDIVRISEGASKTKMTTDSEAQLIGRGARYYPFTYAGEQAFTRRFDLVPSELKALETLYYHT